VLQRCVDKSVARPSSAVKIGSEKVLSQTEKERGYREASKSAVLQSCGPRPSVAVSRKVLKSS